MFKKASKIKLRFETSKGYLSTEDLWGLSLEDLDRIAKGINKKIKEEAEESFIKAKSSNTTLLELKLSILKDIIEDKLAQRESSIRRAENAEKKALLQDLLQQKEQEDLKGMTKEEIKKQLDLLEESTL